MKRSSGNHDWIPSADRRALEARAALLESIRSFFETRGVLEVETPVLSHAGNSDPGITQFLVNDHPLWLRTSPEYAMKRLLAAGSGDIFELGRVFRQGESGRHHNVEFTLLEWYRQGWSYHRLMDEVTGLVRHCLPGFSLRQSKVSYHDLLRAHTGLDATASGKLELSAFIGSKGLEAPRMSRAQMLDLIISHFVQPALPVDGLTLVFDYPAEQAALAKIRDGDPPLAERFELFLGRTELANGYQELTDPNEQEQRFRQENSQREECGQAVVPIDEKLLSAMRSGLPECSGVALGVDRLLMFALGASSLSEVMAFPGPSA
jgi:lysyl-tRNA synthetase class 2